MASMLSDLSDEAQEYAEREQWGRYRNVRYDTAEHVREEEGQWKRAGFLYVEVLIFDLQGVASAPGAAGFHEAYQGPMPGVVHELARFVRRTDMGKEEFKTVYDRVAEQAWLQAFPRSKSEVWAELWELVAEQREALELEEKVEALGRDGLLSEAEAQRYIDCKDDYALIRRVEHILENEQPGRIPQTKLKRARTYLAAIDPADLGQRWRGKAYRRGGEIMLSVDGEEGKKKALEYFKKALDVVDRDEVVPVERQVNRLRRGLDR